MAASNWYDDVVIPALLRAARGTYARAIRASLAAAGFEDLPRNGAFVIGSIANSPAAPLADVTAGLDVSKQAVSQLIDTLVVRGYIERGPDPDDRRRMTVTLTERGAAAAAAVRAGVSHVDTQLAQRLSAHQIRSLRAGLGALVEIRESEHEH